MSKSVTKRVNIQISARLTDISNNIQACLELLDSLHSQPDTAKNRNEQSSVRSQLADLVYKEYVLLKQSFKE